MIIEARGVAVAQGAVIETRPASTPFNAMEISGFPTRAQVVSMASSAPAQAAKLVFTAIKPKAFPAPAVGSAPPVTPVVLPALKPNHPIHRMKTPSVASAIE
jgi:hypothetical protein